MAACTAVSAPGKVLIAGGYLVVERPNIGLSLGLSARFHCVARREEAGAAETEQTVVCVRVHSHQFGTAWTLGYTLCEGALVFDPATCDNAMVRAAVTFALAAVLSDTENAAAVRACTPAHPLHLHLYADNAFYSQSNYLRREGLDVRYANVMRCPPFNPIVGALGKTGLGSSACLVSSIVGCVLQHFGGDVRGPAGRDRVHTVAQFAHCHAQGKIGSGFDVASAVYGSNQYVRFSPERLHALIQGTPVDRPVDVPAFNASLGGALDHTTAPCELPAGMALALADINKGSATPGMVSSVFKWKKSAGEPAIALWEAVAAANSAAAAALTHLHALEAGEYATAVAALERLPCGEWEGAGGDESPGVAAFVAARDAFATTRRLLREVGTRAGVEIEPAQQTELLDATLAAPGVLAAGCPGAGGYDAIYAICLTSAVRESLARLWEGFASATFGVTPGSVCCLDVTQDTSGGLRVSEYTTVAGAAAVYPGLA